MGKGNGRLGRWRGQCYADNRGLLSGVKPLISGPSAGNDRVGLGRTSWGEGQRGQVQMILADQKSGLVESGGWGCFRGRPRGRKRRLQAQLYYLADRLGNIRNITDNAGSIIAPLSALARRSSASATTAAWYSSIQNATLSHTAACVAPRRKDIIGIDLTPHFFHRTARTPLRSYDASAPRYSPRGMDSRSAPVCRRPGSPAPKVSLA